MLEVGGKQLARSTIQTILEQLEFFQTQRPQWVTYHFPKIDQRGRVEYSDIETMTPQEADSVRHLLASQILHGRRKIWNRKAQSVGFLNKDEADEEDSDNEWIIRVRLLKEALEDLCKVYSLSDPL